MDCKTFLSFFLCVCENIKIKNILSSSVPNNIRHSVLICCRRYISHVVWPKPWSRIVGCVYSPTVLYSVFRNSTKAALIVVGHTHLLKHYICSKYICSHLKPFYINVMKFYFSDENRISMVYFFEVYFPILSSSWVLHHFGLMHHTIISSVYLFHTISTNTP